MRMKLLTVLALIVGASLSSKAQTASWEIHSSKSLALNPVTETWEHSINEIPVLFTMTMSPTEVIISDYEGVLIYQSKVEKVREQDFQKWTIYGLTTEEYKVTLALLINKPMYRESGHGILWVNDYNTGRGVELVLTKFLGVNDDPAPAAVKKGGVAYTLE